jgi:hypothetical protein
LAKISKKLEKLDWKGKIGFEIFGIKIGIRMDTPEFFENLRKILPPGSREIPFEETDKTFSIVAAAGTNLRGFYIETDGQTKLAQKFEVFEASSLTAIQNKIQLTLALTAPPKMYFFHAGAVSFENIGIIITGKSFTGKTTLVKEFIKNGAKYYSDDCAVLDSEGYLHPYPNPLAVREADGRNFLSAEFFGAETGIEPVRLEYILITEYQKNAVWNPQAVKPGEGGFKLLEHFFYRMSVRRKPTETLEFLAKLTQQAKVFKSPRNEAKAVVKWFQEVRS